MRRLAKRFLAFIVWTLLTVNLWAQATAQISGTVRDQSGAVLPGVEVTATQTETGIIRTTITNETGSLHSADTGYGAVSAGGGVAGFPYVRPDWNCSAGQQGRR